MHHVLYLCITWGSTSGNQQWYPCWLCGIAIHWQWTLKRWQKVVWGAEPHFLLNYVDGKVCVYGANSMKPWLLNAQLTFNMSVEGAYWPGELPFPQTPTGSHYKDLLADHLHPFQLEVYPDHSFTFQQNHASCHWAHLNAECFEDNNEVSTLPCPPNSPHYNP